MKYRKKPVTIEAYQTDKELDIETLEGTMHASVGDYIITGVRGEQYPCKPDIFEQTYEPADAPTVSPWHRVESKEDLPKESGTYIVYLRQGTKVETPEWMGGEPLSYVVEMEFDREQMLWRADDDAYNAILSFVDTERDFHVTHWTEKPEPPKEGNNGSSRKEASSDL